MCYCVKFLKEKCGYPPEIIKILVKINDLTNEKILKHYKLNGKAFACIKSFVSVINDNDENENDSANDSDSGPHCNSE